MEHAVLMDTRPDAGPRTGCVPLTNQSHLPLCRPAEKLSCLQELSPVQPQSGMATSGIAGTIMRRAVRSRARHFSGNCAMSPFRFYNLLGDGLCRPLTKLPSIASATCARWAWTLSCAELLRYRDVRRGLDILPVSPLPAKPPSQCKGDRDDAATAKKLPHPRRLETQ